MRSSNHYKLFLRITCSWFGLILSCGLAQGQDDHEYKPQFQKIVYRKTVPAQIRRATRKVGPTRFFGTFEKNRSSFAVHFYDESRVVRSKREAIYPGTFERASRLDVFQFRAPKTWRRIQNFTLVRRVDDKQDKIKIEANSLFLGPKGESIPMIYLKVTGNYNPIPTGHRTDIYGLIFEKPKPKAFTTFKGYIPYSPTTATSSEISHPDANGRLTILFIESEPGHARHTAYGWTGESWKKIASAHFENSPAKALRWNGSQFIPSASNLH